MKTSLFFKAAMLLLLAAGFLTGCDKHEKPATPEPPAEITGEQVIARFRHYFYEPDGQVRANKLPGFSAKEWAVCAEYSARPLEVFNDITGLDAQFTDRYDYTFRSSDGECTMRIVGVDQLREDQVYAVLYVEIAECPEIGKVNIITKEYFEEHDLSMSGVPVIL